MVYLGFIAVLVVSLIVYAVVGGFGGVVQRWLDDRDDDRS